MGKGKLVACVVAVAFAGYMVAAPYITVHRMKSAAQRHDGAALSEHVDFPSVRQSLKDQVNAMFVKSMAEDEQMKDNPFAALGVAFAGMIMDKMVDAYVTPAGITQLMAGEKPEPGLGKDPGSSGEAERKPFSDTSMSYESIDKFVVRVKGADGDEGRFILRRRGIGWKLTEIVIPSSEQEGQ